MQAFISELRRRNVLRAAALYCAAAWVLVQAVTQIFPFFHVADSVVRWIVVAAVVGLPLVMLLAWFYELTPQGLVRESRIAAGDSNARQGGRRMDHWIIAVLALAVVLLLADRLVLHRSPAGEAPDAGPGATANSKSIAVLPFANLSDDKANAYFAVGIQDEILTRLAKIGALSVISRTSTAHYASSPDNLPEIARALGVANILEGSVQKAGDAVHVNVQLIRAATDTHLWAETYDRKLDDTFGVESEVAQAIADALNAKLSGDEKAAMDRKPTQIPGAYDAYLRGLAFQLDHQDLDANQKAVEQFTQAVTLDPAFALAWAHLSIVEGLIYFNEDHSPERLAQTEHAAETAMRLQPDLGEAWLARGYFLYRGKADYDGALAAFEQARSHLPNSAEVLAATAFVERRQGKWDDALARLQAAVQQDPGNLSYLSEWAGTLLFLNREADARAVIDRALLRAPGDGGFIGMKINSFINEGNLKAADDLLQAQPPRSGDFGLANARMSLDVVHHQYDAAYRALLPLLTKNSEELGGQAVSIYGTLGFLQRWSGDEAGARATFARGREVGEDLRVKAPSDNVLMALADIEAGLGDRDAALRDAHQAVDLSAHDAYSEVPLETNLAEVEAQVGDTDAAIALLTRLLTVPGGVTPVTLRYDPYLDVLAKDPRFRKLTGQLSSARS